MVTKSEALRYLYELEAKLEVDENGVPIDQELFKTLEEVIGQIEAEIPSYIVEYEAHDEDGNVVVCEEEVECSPDGMTPYQGLIYENALIHFKEMTEAKSEVETSAASKVKKTTKSKDVEEAVGTK